MFYNYVVNIFHERKKKKRFSTNRRRVGGVCLPKRTHAFEPFSRSICHSVYSCWQLVVAVCVARHSQPAAPRYQVEKCRAHTSDPQFCRFYQLLLWLRDMTHFVLWQDGSLVILFILPFRLYCHHLNNVMNFKETKWQQCCTLYIVQHIPRGQ